MNLNTNIFTQVYWSHYVSLEKEFRNTLRFVTLEEQNYNTYSSEYIKLILSIGSEVDIVSKIYANIKDKNFRGKNILDYCSTIIKNEPMFCKVIVKSPYIKTYFKPWESWERGESPLWWKYYNKIKHKRNELDEFGKPYYRFANLEIVILSLAALYQLMIYVYYDLAVGEDELLETPLPGSKLFTLEGDKWDNIHINSGDFALRLADDGHLNFFTSNLPY